MRFLLNARTSGTTLNRLKKSNLHYNIGRTPDSNLNPPVQSQWSSLWKKEKNKNLGVKECTDYRIWGQHYSHESGFVLRFDSQISQGCGTITDCKYTAKALVRDSKNFPLYTMSPGKIKRPLFKQCDNNTLNYLAATVSRFCTGRKLSSVLNLSEFSGIRSSPAFRYSVLRRHGLDPDVELANYDLVEASFLAMIKSLQPRSNYRTIKEREHNFLFNESILAVEETFHDIEFREYNWIDFVDNEEKEKQLEYSVA